MSEIRICAAATASEEDKVAPANKPGVLYSGCLRLPYFSKASPSIGNLQIYVLLIFEP